MIDTKELRRLAQAAKNSCESVEWSHEFRSGRYSQGVIISGEENILIVCGANYGCWRDADDDGDSQFKALGDFVAAANPATISELLDRLEAAESDATHQKALADSALRVAEGWEEKCNALRAKVEAAEKSDAESLAMYRKARDERDALRAALRHEADCVEAAKAEIEALRAKIEAMERQEPARLVTPTAYRWRYRGAIKWQYGELTEETVWLAKEHNHEVQALGILHDAQQCKNCNGMGDRFDPSGEKIPCDLCESHLEEIRSLVAEAAHDIISGSDFWLSISLAAKKIYALPGAQPAPSINEGVRKVTLGFRWESEAQHHIPTIEIEFDPVSPDSPNDAKGWQDRDRIASMLSPEAKP